MAKSTYLGANVEIATDSFGGWINKTNQVIYDMGTVVLTAGLVAQPNSSNGAEATGNSHLEGIFSANSVVATDGLRGGTTSAAADLTVTSNTVFSQSELIDIQANTNLFNVDANNVVISSNVTLDGGSSKNLTATLGNITTTSTLFDITATTFNLSSNSTIDGAILNVDTTDLDITANTTITSDTLTVSSNTTFSNTVNVSGNQTNSADLTVEGDLNVLGDTFLSSNNVLSINEGAITTLNVVDTLEFNLGATVISNITPGTDSTYDIGTNAVRWSNIYADTLNGSLDWSNIANKPSPTVSVALTGDVTGSASATLTELANGSISIATTFANDVVLGTDTSGNYAGSVVAGDGIDVSGSAGEGTEFTVAHANTSSQATVNNTVGSAIRSISLDSFGHITSLTSTNFDTRYPRLSSNNTIASYNTLTKTTVLQSTVIGESAAKIIKNIDDTSTAPALIVATDGEAADIIAEFRANATAASVDTSDTGNSSDSVFQILGTGNVNADGTITAAAFSGDLDYNDITNPPTIGNASITISAGSGLSGGAVFTTNQTSNETITLSHADTSSQASVNNSNGNVIQDITLDTYGHITGLTSLDLDDRYYTESEADSRFLGILAKAADANLFDGLDSSQFLRSDVNDVTSGTLQVDGLGVGTTAPTGGEIRAIGDITAFYSDERLKDFKGTITSALDKVESLNGYYYTANEIAQSLGYSDEIQVGVSAQEVQAILPEVVTKAPISYEEYVEEDYLTVRYEKLIPLLIEAIKELKAEINQLK